MALDKHDKVAIGITAGILAVLYFLLAKNNGNGSINLPSGITLPQPSLNLPWWLSNNQPPATGGFDLPLPTLSNNSGPCQTCSLFPLPQPASGFTQL